MQDKLQSQKCARSLKALADPDRLKIIQCLLGGSKHVSELAQLLGLEIANVSHHLGVLRNAELVRDEKRGKFVVYSLDEGVTSETRVLDLGCCRLELKK
ncbi:MAG: metalloregulator ArsR/SmtB family transcription factor [Gemmataceae bacterium]|nr:metalloregulator ArsR/SmtB family transcription factor [Gemmataceae bacterium]MCI0737604.1 metalloregulator ArsR/SmtB family transcription factor [Gemmataceae bacterium]